MPKKEGKEESGSKGQDNDKKSEKNQKSNKKKSLTGCVGNKSKIFSPFHIPQTYTYTYIHVYYYNYQDYCAYTDLTIKFYIKSETRRKRIRLLRTIKATKGLQRGLNYRNL